MKSILNLGKVLILSLILWGCNPDCDMLQISDASEIQFWRTGEQTSFNLEEEGYTDEGYCFHQKFLCTSQRKLQGIDTGEDLLDYFLIGFDENGEVIYNEQYSFFQETTGYPSDIFQDYPLSGWINEGFDDPFPTNAWTTGAEPFVSTGITATKTDWLTSPTLIFQQTFDIDLVVSVEDAAGKFKVEFFKDDVSVGFVDSPVLSVGADQNVTLTLTITDDADEVKIQHERNTGASSKLILKSIETNVTAVSASPKVYSISFTPSDESMCNKKVVFKIFDGADPEIDNELYYTDEVDFVSVWANNPGSGRVQIQYTNSKNFAGLYYDGSLSYFNIELEGRFRIERPVTAQKVLELSEVILNTATTVKMQRKLTIDDVPDYMHRKIALILAHAGSGSILINGKDWSVEESYEKSTDVPESYPMAPANIWLTEKDYYKHNII